MNLSIERYVWNVSRRLGRKTTPGRRRAIRRELRAHLRVAAAGSGTAAALARAGNPAEVAAEYAEVEAGRPGAWRPVAGAVAAFLTLGVVAALQQRQISLWAAPSWGDFDPWSVDLWLVRLRGDLEQSLLVHVGVDRLAYLVAPLAVFLLAARIWRRAPLVRRPRLGSP